MIAAVPTLDRREQEAVRRLVARLVAAGEPPLLRAVLFGSKARGDFDPDSDVDVLFICSVHPDERDRAGLLTAQQANAVAAPLDVRLEPWAVAAADLAPGCRTPMLVDALADGIPLWPVGAPAVRVPFTPADARFCVECLLGWVRRGGPITRRALADRRPADAAGRARDDITRLATAALLVTGDTRHRRLGSLERFEARFVRRRLVSPRVLAALAWSRAAYPPDSGRGVERPPVTPAAMASAQLGCELASIMEGAVVPWVAERVNLGWPRAAPPWSPHPATAADRPRSGIFPCAAP